VSVEATDGRTDPELLAATTGDPEAFGVLYGRYEAPVLRFFLRRGATAELAADLAGETFAAALLSAGRFRGDRYEAITWVYGIARAVLAQSRRRGVIEDRARRKLGMAPVPLADAAREAIQALRGGEVVDFDERTYPKIAENLRCSEMVVPQRARGGLQTVRTRMEEAL
jgi:DNA-directed RNA polymerase specialized sigma24 family protein